MATVIGKNGFKDDPFQYISFGRPTQSLERNVLTVM